MLDGKNFSRVLIISFLILYTAFADLRLVGTASAYSFSESSGLNRTAQEAGFKTETTNNQNVFLTKIGKVISLLLGILGVAFMGLLIYGGFTWMSARGNESEAEKAKKIMTNAVIGLIIILSAYAITAAVKTFLLSEAQSG